MNVTVYLGSNEGSNPALRDAVAAFGGWLGANGHTLVYGGSNMGLMGTLARAAMASGGRVVGVEPRMFVEKEFQLDGLDELVVTETMGERKAKMIELGDAFVAFPGGTGTLDEISEIMMLNSLRLIDAPCVLYNLDGFYDGLRLLLERMTSEGLSSAEKLRRVRFVSTVDELAAALG